MSSLVSVNNLTFSPQGALEPALDDVSLSLPKGSRTLLIGANGGQPLSLSRSEISSPVTNIAGKSTLLQILAGKKLIKGADVTIKGLDVFYQFPEGVTFLGTEWYSRKAIRCNPGSLSLTFLGL
jgi:CCR4-NOT complex subunit CAF16